MANYETLKAAIQHVIKTNDNNEITGALLQQSLLAMINSLGAGYQFIGIATTKTNPEIYDQKVFYIANGTGVYSNFGGITIDEDKDGVVLLVFDTSWHKVLTGIASNSKLTALFNDVKTDVAALERDLGQYAELPSVAMTAETTGKYINADGEFVDDADFNIAAIGAVVVGNTYELYMGSADNMKLGVSLFVARINNLWKKVDLKSFADGYYESMRVGTADNLTSKGDATEEVIMSRRAGGYNQIEDGSASIKRIKGYSVVCNQKIDLKDGAKYTSTEGLTFTANKNKILITGKASRELYVSVSILQEEAYKTIPNHRYLVLSDLSSSIGLKVYFNDEKQTQKWNDIITAGAISGEPIFAIPKDFDGDTHEVKFYLNIIDLTQMFSSGSEPTTPGGFAKRLGYSSINDVPYIPYNEGEIVSSFAEGIKTTDTEGKVSERKWSETLKKYFPNGLKSAGSAFDEITPTKAVKRIKYLVVDETVSIDGLTVSGNYTKFTIKGELTDAQFEGFASAPFYYKYNGGYYYDVWAIGFASRSSIIGCVPKSVASNTTELRAFLKKLKDEGNPLTILYQLVPEKCEEYTYDELNLTEQVAEGGTEEAIITEGKTSTPLRADIVYPIDAYNTIKANKANIGTLSSLNTASKTDLVSAINELAGKVAALEAKATEVTNETTE